MSEVCDGKTIFISYASMNGIIANETFKCLL